MQYKDLTPITRSFVEISSIILGVGIALLALILLIYALVNSSFGFLFEIILGGGAFMLAWALVVKTLQKK